MKKMNYLVMALLLSVSAAATDLTTGNFVEKANLTELSKTYDNSKIEKALGEFDYINYTQKELQDLALLIDLDMVEKKDISQNIDEELTFALSAFTDTDKNYLGFASDKSIYEKVLSAWNSFSFYDDSQLVDELTVGLMNEVYTGYNIKRPENNPNFNEDLALTYGHGDIAHAIQLIALMKTENIEARVQLEPKTSSFTYLKEWGEPRNTPTYKVVKNDSNKWVAYAKEYDLSFEFESIEDRANFKEAVTKYAKKDVANEEGLIVSSWWQPLYYSRVDLDGYNLLVDNIAIRGEYEIHIFSLENKSQAIQDSLDTKIKKNIYVNQAFYNYMLGDYK